MSKTTLSKTDKSKTGRRGVCFGTFPAAVISAAAVFLLVTLRDINIFGAGLLSKLDFPSSEAVGLLGGADLRPFFDFCIAILYAIRAAILLFAAFFTFHGLFSRKSKKSKSSGASSRARRIAVCISAVILIAAALVFCYFSEIPAESKASAEIPLSYSDALPTLRLAAVILLSVIIPLLMLLSGVFRKQNRKIRHIRGE